MIPEKDKPIPITNADYEKAENDLLLEGLRRTPKERFLFLMALIKAEKTMRKMQITHAPPSDKKS